MRNRNKRSCFRKIVSFACNSNRPVRAGRTSLATKSLFSLYSNSLFHPFQRTANSLCITAIISIEMLRFTKISITLLASKQINHTVLKCRHSELAPSAPSKYLNYGCHFPHWNSITNFIDLWVEMRQTRWILSFVQELRHRFYGLKINYPTKWNTSHRI